MIGQIENSLKILWIDRNWHSAQKTNHRSANNVAPLWRRKVSTVSGIGLNLGFLERCESSPVSFRNYKYFVSDRSNAFKHIKQNSLINLLIGLTVGWKAILQIFKYYSCSIHFENSVLLKKSSLICVVNKNGLGVVLVANVCNNELSAIKNVMYWKNFSSRQHPFVQSMLIGLINQFM